MAEQSLKLTPQRTRRDQRLTTAIKILLVVILVGLFTYSHDDDLWPLVTWPMYATYGNEPPAAEASTIRFYVIDRAGKTYSFSEQEFYGQMPTGDGTWALRKAFDVKDADDQRANFVVLLERAKTLLPGTDIARIQGWGLYWYDTDKFSTPPFDLNQPDERQLIGGFSVVNGEVAS